MINSLTNKFTPRANHILYVLGVERISKESQDELSLDDQEALLKQYIRQRYDGQIEFKSIKSQGSGEYLDRSELYEIERLIESRQLDVVICEDLGRICRRRRAYDLCELCEDHGTRLIALNDHVDTANDGWQDSAFISTWHHERSNRDTSDRIRRSLRNRFSNGGIIQTLIYGFIKPDGAKSDQDVYKDPEAEAIYEHWFTMLENGATYSDVADWLNKEGVHVGPGSRSGNWSCKMVKRVTYNPILKGLRVRNKKKSQRINRTGRRKSVDSPLEEILTRSCLHLAFINPDRYDRLIKMLDDRNKKYRRKGKNGKDTRKNISKKRTRFPGQMVECGICGRKYVFGGHGQKDHLMCDGARDHSCWNGVTVDGPLATEKILSAVLAEIEQLPDFDQKFLEKVHEESRRLDQDLINKQSQLERDIHRQEQEIENLLSYLRSGNTSERVSQDLKRLESEHKDNQLELSALKDKPHSTIEIPDITDLKDLARTNLLHLEVDSWEFRLLMQRLIPKIVVFPYQLCDGGKIVLRTRFRLFIAGLLENSGSRGTLQKPLERILTVDLFDPPQRAAYREAVIEVRQANPIGKKKKMEELAQTLGLTVTAMQYAVALHRKMNSLGITDPYMPITEPPESGKLRRHKHPRYQFTPLPHAGEI
ncbi:recombinase family protein [Gimesia maris]|uniref:Recombinase domain-containing protein n=1 Tax=Gimesia maris TaxID=122 RepID=A0A3D3R0J4_9PLAN|nr:hypothetical protein [Gimesia sp.]HCO22353.1 hypothetical protein [Gimesia maris]|tara:strand:+ start:125476 stop:127425 length:1950 start_codon:yes stop_codon:yes gene_type:complete